MSVYKANKSGSVWQTPFGVYSVDCVTEIAAALRYHHAA